MAIANNYVATMTSWIGRHIYNAIIVMLFLLGICKVNNKNEKKQCQASRESTEMGYVRSGLG